MTHFYLTLPSNSSEAYYPDNTLTGFTTKLHNKIALQGEWEVGLSDIIFPRTWFNIGRYQYITIRYCSSVSSYDIKSPSNLVLSDGSSVFPEEFFAEIMINPGYFSTVESLTMELNRLIKEQFTEAQSSVKPGGTIQLKIQKDGWPKFEYNRNSQKVYLTVQSFTQVDLSNDLIDIFGFNKNRVPFTNYNRHSTILRSDRTCDINSGRHAIYVYCDILECVPVGDTMAPLLRTIDVTGEHGSMQHRDFVQPRYIPLQKKDFDSLTIDIRDGLGRKIPFENGTLMVTLHFKRANSSYFVI